MAEIIEHKIFSKTDLDANNNKFWKIWLYDDGQVETQNGRQGAMGQRRFITATGRGAYDAKLKEKLRKGYVENKTADSDSSSVSTVSNSTLRSIASKQIKNNSPTVQELIDYLVQVNAHQITSRTGGKIVFDTSTAQFKTTVGVVVPDQVRQARNLLDDLANFVNNRDWDNYSFKTKLNNYLSLIPRDFGRHKMSPREILPNIQKIQEENDILDGLDASFAGLIQTPTTTSKDKEPEVFSVELHLIDDKKVISRIKDNVNRTRKSGHVCRHLKLVNVYEVTINNMKKSFEKDGKKIDNIKQLYHGSRSSNLLSILRQGLVIPPSHSSHCTGRLLGNGCYFASSSTKSLNYSYGYWSGSRSNKCFMFITDVALGKTYTPNSLSGRFPKPGYDSIWAKAGVTGYLKNDEFVVYRTSQSNFRYLLEFKG